MAKIARAFQKIFAGGITPTGNIGVFGSLAAGSPAYSSDADTIQSLDAWTNGWAAATVNNQSPAFQDFNGYQYVVTRQLAYLMQAGIPEWNSQTTYYIGSFCQVAGVIYQSLIDDNLNNSVTNTGSWTTLKSVISPPSQTLSLAWVNFKSSPSGAVINSSYNVTSVTRTALGVFTINFTNALSSANYCVTGSGVDLNPTSAPNGIGCIGESMTTGNAYVLKTTTQLSVSFADNGGGAKDVSTANIVIFGG